MKNSIRKTIFLVLLAWLILPNTVFAAQIVVEPGTSVRTGEELLFNASNYLIENPSLEKFNWDFGDSYTLNYPEGGISVTHVYSKPGHYNVTLFIINGTQATTQTSVQITVSGNPVPSNGFELWHADFHGHTAQYIYAQISAGLISSSTKRLLARVGSDTGYNNVIHDKTNLQTEEKILLRNADLPAGNYILTAQLLDASNKIISEINEYFEKPYNGAPKAGIDENNAIRVDGKLFFPVTPFGLNDVAFQEWLGADAAINILFATGFWHSGGYETTQNLDSWQHYLNQAQSYNIKVIGPDAWDGQESKKSNLNRLIEYVRTTKNHNSIFSWTWFDEPDLGGNDKISSQVIRSWTYACHHNDPQHLVVINFAGPNWLGTNDYLEGNRRTYEYLYNENLFGKKTFSADILGFDFYPIEWASPHWRDSKVSQLVTIMDRIREENYNLAPIFSFVETSDINEPPYPNPYAPTPEQVTMLTWLNVIHGAKGINWFHHHGSTPPENFVAMRKFLTQITALTPVVLGPEVGRAVTNDAAAQGGRVDTMIREYNNNTYIFAVRLTEVPEVNNPPVNVTFNVSGITNATAEVYGETRTINVAGGAFQDAFAPNAVHIYRIPIGATVLYGDVSGDNKVTAYDAALTAQSIVGLISISANQTRAADVDANGEVAAYDAALIAQYAVGIIDHFPAEQLGIVNR